MLICHHAYYELLYLAFRFVKSKAKSACGEERGTVGFPLSLCTGLFGGAARKDKVSVIVTHCYDSGTRSRTADKSLTFVTKNTNKISHLAVNDPASDSWLSFTKAQSCSFSSVMFTNVVQRRDTLTGPQAWGAFENLNGSGGNAINS